MTIEELIKKYAPNRNNLIEMYAKSAMCDVCPLRHQCPVKWEAIQKCVNYLTRILETEE